MQHKHFQARVTLLSGVLSLSWNFCRKHGKIWLQCLNSARSMTQLRRAWKILPNGIRRQVTQVHTSFALVNTILTLYPLDITDNNGTALDPNVKVAYAEHQWDKLSCDTGLKKFKEIVSYLLRNATVLMSIHSLLV